MEKLEFGTYYMFVVTGGLSKFPLVERSQLELQFLIPIEGGGLWNATLPEACVTHGSAGDLL